MARKPVQMACRVAGGVFAILVLAMLAAGCSAPGSQNPSSSAQATPTPSPSPSPSPSPAATPAPTPSPTPDAGLAVRNFQWSYQGTSYQFQLSIAQPASGHYQGLPHVRGSDYAAYAISASDRPYLPVDALLQNAKAKGYGEYDTVMLVQAFVQSLQETSGYDDYPQYPVETLLSDGGDSEDTSILAAALLDAMGYDTIVLEFPDHMGVGVKGSDLQGRYYMYDGAEYTYLETAAPGYAFGTQPDAYRNETATILPLSGFTQVTVNCSDALTGSETLYADYTVHCTIQDAGMAKARNVSVYVAAMASDYGPDEIWIDNTTNVGDIAVDAGTTADLVLRIPRSGHTQIECFVYGDNFDQAEWKGDPFEL